MKKILIILGHPDAESFCGAIANSYAAGAKKSGHKIKTLNLGEIDFDPILHKGYKEIQTLEPDLVTAQTFLRWADHIVIVFPTWWFNVPSILKGFIDRAILPGFGFKYLQGKMLPKKLLSGRSAHLITTSDGPGWYYQIVTLGHPGLKALKHGTLKFCGVSPIKQTLFSKVSKATKQQRKKWLSHVKKMGQKAK